MGSAGKLWNRTRFCSSNLELYHGIWCQKMSFICISFLGSVLSLLRFIHRIFFSFRVRSSSYGKMIDKNYADTSLERNNEEEDSTTNFIDERDETEPPKLVFRFEYQTQTFDQVKNSFHDSIPSPILNEYENSGLKGLHSFVENPEDLRHSVKVLYPDSVNDSREVSEALEDEILNDHCFLNETNVLGKSEEAVLGKTEETFNDHFTLSKKIQLLSEKDLFATESDSDSENGKDMFNNFVSSKNDGFSSDSDFEDFFTDSQTGELSSTLSSDMLTEGGLGKNSPNEEKFHDNGKQALEDDSEDEDSKRMESLWEHQELIDQINMELKKVRAVGLPTILEESECPKIMEDLKPWKIDDTKLHHHQIGELHKLYKTYRERMRKFDILNYQKIYALGLLLSKDPFEAITVHKASPNPTPILSILPENLRAWLPARSKPDPMENFVTEIYGDLEAVYVGQLCLSWEILRWQYEKAIELWESDHYNVRRYNEAAGEFQHFQVLTQRFIEHEPFEGPRVQYYVKKRCRLRNLLQVPVIREDRRMGNRVGKNDVGAITSDRLLDIMEESIRILWRFIRADKQANSTFQKRQRESEEDAEDLEILNEIKSTLQKKEKRLKDAKKCESCILKRFQKNEEEEGSEAVLYFFSQVEMRLVRRVLNMAKINRERLIWCRDKLSTISLVGRRINVEPSFLLFPS